MLEGVGKQPSLLRGQLSVLSFVRMTLDPAVIVASLVACTLAYTRAFRPADLVLALIVFSLTFPGHLRLAPGARGLLREILTSWAVVVFMLLFLGWATGFLGWYDERAIGVWMGTTPFAVYAAHRLAPRVLPRLLAVEGYRTAVIAGLTEPGRRLAEQFAHSAWLGVKVLAFFDDRGRERLGDIPAPGLKGKLADLAKFVKETGVDAIFITLPMASQPRILRVLDELRDTTASIYFVPDIFLYDLIQARVDDISGIPVVAVCESPFHGVNGLVKRLSDIVLATAILALVAPLMLAIAAGVKLSSPGPVIFRQRRYGLDGKEIIVYKFRTMRVMEDGDRQYIQVTRDDPRVTRFGRLLRKYSLDEMPQFLNVLQGRMSVVGPRPHAIAVNENYRKVIRGYMIRHKVKPGVTGWAQIHGLRGGDDLQSMQRRVEFDLAYLRNWSLKLDLEIILKTVLVVLKGDRSAY